MTEESSTTSDLSETMTATGMTQITGGNNTPPSPRGIQFYFQCVVLVIGVVATAANALILYALVASKQHKKHALILNQNALDLFGSFFLIISYSVKLCNVYFAGSAGYWLCTLLFSESLWSCGIIGSIINLSIISVERYLKAAYPVWSKTKLRNWMIWSAAAFAWIGSIIYNAATVFSTTVVMNGMCYPYAIWKSKTAKLVHFIFNFVSFYVLTLLIFIFCYWRILIVIRRQARVMAAHMAIAGGSSTAQTQSKSNQIQTNIIKTMLLVSILYAVTWLPIYVSLILNLNSSPTPDGAYYASVFISFVYICINPFIYATKFDPVKEILLRMIPKKKIPERATENIPGARADPWHVGLDGRIPD